MKLFVYCPSKFNKLEGSEEWEKALNLSRQSKLPIVSNIKDFEYIQEPKVIQVPEKSFFSIDKKTQAGFIHRIDITDEFFEMDESVTAFFLHEDGSSYEHSPIVREKHKIKFRTRHKKPGKYTVKVQGIKNKYLEDSFEII